MYPVIRRPVSRATVIMFHSYIAPAGTVLRSRATREASNIESDLEKLIYVSFRNDRQL